MQKAHQGLAWIAAMALFMQSLDATILNTALPAIASSLQESALEMQLAIISYALTVAACIPLSGWLADRFGTLRIFRWAILLFVLGSIACAMANSLNLLILARILQGVGGSLMMPTARLAIIRTVPKTSLMSVWNLMAMSGLVGPILGPLLGGWLVTHASWHWIFLINIPIGLLGIALSKRYMPNVFGEIAPLDWAGLLIFSSALVALTLGLELLSEKTLEKSTALFLLVLAVALFYGYYLYAKRHSKPLFSLDLFKVRTFSVGMLINLFTRLTGSGIPFLLPLMFQLSFQYNAETAGWLVAPIALASILVKPLIGKIVARFSYKRTLFALSALMSLIIACMSLLHEQSPLWQVLLLATGYGFCMSIIFTAVNTLSICDLNEKTASAGSTLLSMGQQVGIGIGIAISSILLNFYRANPETPLQQAFSHTFLSSAIIGMLLCLATLFLRAKDGESLYK